MAKRRTKKPDITDEKVIELWNQGWTNSYICANYRISSARLKKIRRNKNKCAQPGCDNRADFKMKCNGVMQWICGPCANPELTPEDVHESVFGRCKSAIADAEDNSFKRFNVVGLYKQINKKAKEFGEPEYNWKSGEARGRKNAKPNTEPSRRDSDTGNAAEV